MSASDRWRECRYLLIVVAGALYFAAVLWFRSQDPSAPGSNDTYTYFYPNFDYAIRALRDGAGLFWNPYQDCGQPFFAISQTALLYPVNWVTALLEREPALITMIIINLSIAGAAVFRLGRAIGLSPPAAISAALAFELGGSTTQMAAWSPIHIAPYAWLAVALWLTERLVARPDFARAAAVGVALTIQLLPGFPQIVFFTYQLIALRIAWAIALKQTAAPGALALNTLLAFAIPLGLAAVQLVPSFEVARESVRTLPLRAGELGGFRWSWESARVQGSIDLLRLFLAGVALLGCRTVTRAHAIFYALVAGLYATLARGPGTALFDLYASLPMGSTFRGSARLLWVVGFALAVLAGIGVQAVLDRRGRARCSWIMALVPPLAGVVLLHWMAPSGLATREWVLVPLLLALIIAAAVQPRFPSAVVLPLVVGMLAIAVVPTPFQGLRSGDLYHGNADAFHLIKERLTPQERVMIVGRPGDYGLMPKSAMLFAVPDVFDYEPLVSQSYAEYFTYMRTGRGLQQLDDWYWIFKRLLPDSVEPRLFDLLAVRYVLMDRSANRLPPVLSKRFEILGEIGAVRIFENRTARARARYVPRIVVKPSAEILPVLVDGSIDPTRAAVVGAPPRSGFLGSDVDASGTADIIDSQPERVSVHVRATAPGFLYLGDQIFPGWQVHVNGEERELLRANYTFRLVEVPAGDSDVVFTYHPRVVWLGALISTMTVLLLLVLSLVTRRRPVDGKPTRC